MQEFKARVQELVDKYEGMLAEKGIRIAVSKKYFETEVYERSGSSGGAAIFNFIARARDSKKEKERGYDHQRNKYHCLVLSVLPTEKGLVRREDCRDYAFLLRKVERAHIGQEPERIVYAEDRLLAKIEKRILKILKLSEGASAEEVCKNTFRDVLRYCSSIRYEYKEEYLGKDSYTWEMIFGIALAAIVISLLIVAWIAVEMQ